MARARTLVLAVLASAAGSVTLLVALMLSPLGTKPLVRYAAQRAAAAADLTLEIGSVSGALWGDVQLEDVTAHRGDGAALTLRRLTFGLELLPLLSRRMRVVPLSAHGGWLRLPLSSAPADTTPDERASGSGWTLEVTNVAVRDVEVVLLHASWIDRVLDLASIDTLEHDSLVLSDVRIEDGAITLQLGEGLTGEVTVSGAGTTVTPLAMQARRLDMRATMSGPSITVQRLRLELAHGSLSARGRLYRESKTLSAAIQIDSLQAPDLGALAPAGVTGVSVSGEAMVRAGQPTGRWTVALTRGVLRDLRNDGFVEASGVVRRTPPEAWSAVRGSIAVSGIATERVPGGDLLPQLGRIDGTIEVEGTADIIRLLADLRLTGVDGADVPESVLMARGGLELGAELRFDSLRAVATTPLAMLRRWIPGHDIPGGIVTVDGVVDGPLRRPRVRGILRRRLAQSERVKDSLAFTVDPHLAGNGSPVDMNGRTGQLGPLRYALEYGGRPGRAAATGVIAVVDSLWRVDAVQLTASGFDLQSVFPQAPASDITLSGGGKAQIVDGTLALVRGSLRMGPSTLADEPLDALIAGEWTPGDVVVESLAVATSGLSLRGQGRLRAGAAPDDTVTLSLEVARLSDLTPLLRAMHNLVPALPDSGPSGSLALQAAITGSPAAPEASVELHAEDLRFGQVGAARIALSGAVDSTRRGVAAIAIDTLHVAGRTAERVGLDIAGGADSARVGITARRGAGRLAAALEVESPRSGRLIRIDSLLVGNSAETWRARPGGSIFVGGGAVRVDSLSLEGERGGIVVFGAVSRTDSTALVAGLRRVPLRGLALLAAVDTVDVTGTVSGSVRLEGPLATPSGVVTLATDSTRLHGAAVADVSLDLTLGPRGTEVAAALGQDSSVVLDGRVPLWIQGDPLRLAFQEEGALNLQVRVTRADLRRLHPFLVNVEDPTGELSADVRLGGTWREPDVSGTVTLRDGRLSVPALGVAYDRITLAAKFERSRAVIDSLLFVTGEGRMLVSGAVRLAPLHDPTLRLSASARGFEVMRDDQLLTLRADGELEVRGRLRAPVVHGEIEAPEAVLHFASLIDKSVVDLSDPVFAAVVDTSVLQRAALEPGLLREVRDSLVLDSVTVTLGSDVWLRSDDANIQLDGSATIGKRGDRYRVFGTFTARRGTYELALGPAISREFRIEGGTVRFFGDPRTDAEIDIEAEHTVRTFRGDRVGVTATIGGTVAEPEVSLSSSLGARVSDSEIVSYLLFGAPSVQVFAGRRGRQDQTLFERSAQQLADVLSGTLERSLTGSLGVPVDHLRIDPGDVDEGFSGAEIEIGKQIDVFGQPAFLTASPRLCPGRSLLISRTTGASLETWLADEWLMAVSLDPVRGCEAAKLGTSGYSVGLDVFWEKH